MSFKSRIKDPLVDRLFEAILLLRNQEECYRFFDDLCTVGEIKALAQRLEVARLLHAHRTYMNICQTTGASTATVSRVKRFLNSGSGGYKLVLQRLAEQRHGVLPADRGDEDEQQQ